MGTTGSISGTPVTTSGTSLTTLQDICEYHGWHDTTSSGTTALTRFINRTLQLLAVLKPWPEYAKRDGRITLATDDDDYICTTDGDANISNIASIGSVICPEFYTPITEYADGMTGWLLDKRTTGSTGRPTKYALRKYVSAGDVLMEMLVYPMPTSAENGDYLYFPYRTRPAELSSGSDVTDWPDYRLWLLEGALEQRLASQNRDSAGVALESPEFMYHVGRAFAESRVSYMPIQAIPASDTRDRGLRETAVQGM